MKRFLFLLTVLCLSLAARAQIRAGDILCVQSNDTTIVHPEDYTGGGIGVVFYVDETGQHGWALHPQLSTGATYWSYEFVLPFGLTGWESMRDAIYDLDGYENTGFLRAASAYDHDLYPAAWAVDYEHGWYWPALGQLNILFGNAYVVNQSLQKIGGTLMDGYWCYWSSSAFGFDNDCALYLGSNGCLAACMKSRTGLPHCPLKVRSIRDF